MQPLRPSPRVLTVWRMLLALAGCVPAFLLSFFLAVGGLWWSIGTGAWVLLFLFMYLFFLPEYYRSISLSLDKERVIMRSGVFSAVEHIIPLQSVQFTKVLSDPVYRLFGLASLYVVAPGGRMIIPGLEPDDARRIARLLPDTDAARTGEGAAEAAGEFEN